MYNIDNSFFKGLISIPNIQEINGANIDNYIEEGCYLFLFNLLGAKLYNELKSNLDDELNLKPNADQKWKDLFFGCSYGDKYFEGLIQEHLTFNESVMANYVFCHWLQSEKDSVTGVGSVVLQGKNAVNVNPSERYNLVWNIICEKVGVENHHHHADKRVTRIHGLKFIDYYGGVSGGNVTISEFIRDRQKDFKGAPLNAPNGESYTIKTWLL